MLFEVSSYEHFRYIIKQFLQETSNLKSITLEEVLKEMNMISTTEQNPFGKRPISHNLQLSQDGTEISPTELKMDTIQNYKHFDKRAKKCIFCLYNIYWRRFKFSEQTCSTTSQCDSNCWEIRIHISKPYGMSGKH